MSASPSSFGGSLRTRPPETTRRAVSGRVTRSGLITRSQCSQAMPRQVCDVSRIVATDPTPGKLTVSVTAKAKLASGALT